MMIKNKKTLSAFLFVLLGIICIIQAYQIYAADCWPAGGCDSFDCVYVYYGSVIVYHASCLYNGDCRDCPTYFFPSVGANICRNVGRATLGQPFKPCNGAMIYVSTQYSYRCNGINCDYISSPLMNFPLLCTPPGAPTQTCGA